MSGRALIAEVAFGPQRGVKAVLAPGAGLTVGSDPAAGWTLADRGLAGLQLELRWDGERGSLRHLGGATTTWLDGQAREDGPVGHGTWIRAGQTDITLVGERHTPPREQPHPAVYMQAAPALAGLRAAPGKLFAVVDAARGERVRTLLRESPAPYCSLYDGAPADAVAESAPYAAELDPQGELLADLVHEGWGRRWGVFFSGEGTLAELRRHLRKFLMVELRREPVYFRFYDPYVLRAFLTTCTPAERRELLGPYTCRLIDADGGLVAATP